jgi:2-polyprenyl-3-methyl-5-hydroxy-6-metoxy-1,4-benzoquinol methylase
MEERELKKKKLTRACPICLNSLGDVLYIQKFHLYKGHCLPDAYDVVSCKKCGFSFADNSATQNDYNFFYSQFSKYESSASPCSCRINSYDADKYERTVYDLGKIVTDKNSSILDIGCAKGGLLATLKLHGYSNLTGLDPSSSCVNQIKMQGIHALQGGLFRDNFPGDFLNYEFDCVIISHVIEHVYDLVLAISNALALVKQGGVLYLEVPDASRYTRYYVCPYHYFDLEHINHFDEHSLANLMSRYDCQHLVTGKNDLQHSNLVYYPLVYSIYRKNRAGNKQISISPDFEVRENLIRYIEMSRQAEYWPELEELASSGEEVVVWGAGAYALRLYRSSLLKRCNIISFVDSDPKKKGKEFDTKVRISLPKEVLPKFKGTVIVCSAVYNNEIVKEIGSMGINNRVVVLR